MLHGFVEFIRRIIEAFKTTKAGGTAARRRREPPPRCPQCRGFLDAGETHDHEDEEQDDDQNEDVRTAAARD